MSNELDALTESAKAGQEIAKLGSKVVDAATNAAPFFNRVFGRPLEDATGMLVADPLRAARILTQDWLARRVNEKLRLRNLKDADINAVPPSIAVPLLEAAQDENRDELKEVWASLLANAMDPNRSSTVRLEFIQTVRQLNPLDARVLTELHASPTMAPNSRDFLAQALKTDRDEIVVVAIHLEKLGCIDMSKTDRATYGLLSYGKLLLRACQGP
ncbi:Abi-alpha family protein [Bradyrhizobium oligotrophicum]|uniref:Abi-alpha family protein n=1 Tax=Bradyrhizobium oligotrophicum TaxID=44255 RepID=UPI003EBB435C